MKAVISSTYDSTYLFFLPITTWCWNKLGVDVICFLPNIEGASINTSVRLLLAFENATKKYTQTGISIHYFDAPENKQATYAQCSRLFAAALDFPKDEILIVSDIDMALFKVPPYVDGITILGSDLVPEGQYPMCYASGRADDWKQVMKIGDKNFQQCLDELLGGIECENFRGNYWAKDQETLWENSCDVSILIPRARPGTQFASNRIDRDDAYFIERLSPDIIDYHMHRPGFLDDNFAKIISVIQYFYPHDDLTWMREYKNAYQQLL